jgi:hypothetical protein
VILPTLPPAPFSKFTRSKMQRAVLVLRVVKPQHLAVFVVNTHVVIVFLILILLDVLVIGIRAVIAIAKNVVMMVVTVLKIKQKC